MSEEWGDWTWAYKTQGWLGTAVVRSTDRGNDNDKADNEFVAYRNAHVRPSTGR